MRAAVKILLLAVLLGGCASHQWAPGPGMSAADFEPAKARCSLMARHAGGSFAAYGDPNFVAGAAVGNAIGNSVRTQQDFNDCMLAGGWNIADGQAPSTLASVASSPRAQEFREILGAAKNCIVIARAKPEYDPLLPHLLPLDTGRYTLKQQADESLPSAQEATLLSSYMDGISFCRIEPLKKLGVLSPAVAAIYRRAENDNEATNLLLVKRQITWGEAAERQQKVLDGVVEQLHHTPL